MKNRDFRPISRFISEAIQDMTINTPEDKQELVCDIWNGAISNDIEWTSRSRQCHSSTSNNREMVQDRAILAVRWEVV